MNRDDMIDKLVALARALGAENEGTEWYLFGSADRGEDNPSDVDLMILCKNDEQADALRREVDPDYLVPPIHLALLTFEEAVKADVIRLQHGRLVFASSNQESRFSGKAT